MQEIHSFSSYKTEKDLQTVMNTLMKENEKIRLMVNKDKTKYMIL